MKITIAYLPEEEQKESIIMHFLWHFLPETKTRISNNHPPFKHAYLATKKPEKACNSEESS